MASAPSEPPGSRVTTTPRPWALRRSANFVAWVDLPVPSPPSNVMKRPCIKPGLFGTNPQTTPPPVGLRSQTFGAGPEQTDDQLAGRVEGALAEVALGNAFGSL